MHHHPEDWIVSMVGACAIASREHRAGGLDGTGRPGLGSAIGTWTSGVSGTERIGSAGSSKATRDGVVRAVGTSGAGGIRGNEMQLPVQQSREFLPTIREPDGKSAAEGTDGRGVWARAKRRPVRTTRRNGPGHPIVALFLISKEGTRQPVPPSSGRK